MRDEIIDVMQSHDRPLSPMQISKITGKSLGSIAYHVRTLVAAGAIELVDEGRVRGAVEHFFALTPEGAPPASDPINKLLVACGALTVPGSGDGYPQPVVLDDNARNELRDVLDKVQPRVRRIVAESTARAA